MTASSSAVVATNLLLRRKVAAAAVAVVAGSGRRKVSSNATINNNNNNKTLALPSKSYKNKNENENKSNKNENNKSNLKNILKHGIGRITATASTSTSTTFDSNSTNTNNNKIITKTNLTRLSYKSPTRLLSLHNKSSVSKSSGTIVAISNYGGGMLQNDTSNINIDIKKNASLGIITQGSNRIYKQKQKHNESNDDDEYCTTNLHVTIEDNGLLVFAPDPTVLFATSSLRQSQTIHLKTSSTSSSSLALIDWFSSGRYRNGESYQFNNLQSTTRLLLLNNNNNNDETLFLQDSIKMDLRINNRGTNTTTTASSSSSSEGDEDLHIFNPADPFIGINNNNNNGSSIQTFASLILFGDQVDTVQRRCYEIQDMLVKQKTRIRKRSSSSAEGDVVVESDDDDGDEYTQKMILLDSLAGDFYLGISPVDIPITTTTTTTTETSSKSNFKSSNSSKKSTKSKSKSKTKKQQAHVIRMAATTNEDVYRILNYCLQPLKFKFGYEFYKDRIRACKSEIPTKSKTTSSSLTNGTIKNGNNTTEKLDRSAATNGVDNTTTAETTTSHNNNKNLDMLWEQYYQQIKYDDYQIEEGHNKNNNNNKLLLWSTYILGDSSFPIGSFAHSSGLESAVQLGIIKSTNDLEQFIQAAIRSTLQMTVPYILEGHRLVVVNEDTTTTSSFEIQWKQLNKYAQAALCCNSIACSASLDQGKSLSRVIQQWLLEEEENDDDNSETQQQQQQQQRQKQLVLQCLRQDSANNDCHHIGPTFGIVTKLLHLSPKQACELYGYTIGRDIVSAAVRMNLIGPIKSVSLLDKLQSSVEIGIKASLTSILHEHEQQQKKKQNGNDDDDDDESLLFNTAASVAAAASGTSAPILEAIHPCHEILQTRLFRS